MSNTSLSEAGPAEEAGEVMQVVGVGPEVSGRTSEALLSFFQADRYTRLSLVAVDRQEVCLREEVEPLRCSFPFPLPVVVAVGEMKQTLPLQADQVEEQEQTAVAVRPPTVRPETRRARAQAKETTAEPEHVSEQDLPEAAVAAQVPLAETEFQALPVAQAAMGRQAQFQASAPRMPEAAAAHMAIFHPARDHLVALVGSAAEDAEPETRSQALLARRIPAVAAEVVRSRKMELCLP